MTMVVPQSLELEDIEGDEEYDYAMQAPPVPRLSPKRKRRVGAGTPKPVSNAGTPMGGFEGYEYPGSTTPAATSAEAPGWDDTSVSDFSTTAAPGGKGGLRSFAPVETRVITNEMLQGEIEERGAALAKYHAKRKEMAERVDSKDQDALLAKMRGHDPDAKFQVPILDYALNQDSLMLNNRNVSTYTSENRKAESKLAKRRDKWAKIDEDEKYEPVSLIAQMQAQKEAEKAAEEKRFRDLQQMSPAKAAMLERKKKRLQEEEEKNKYIMVKIPISAAEEALMRKKEPSEEELFELRRLQIQRNLKEKQARADAKVEYQRIMKRKQKAKRKASAMLDASSRRSGLLSSARSRLSSRGSSFGEGGSEEDDEQLPGVGGPNGKMTAAEEIGQLYATVRLYLHDWYKSKARSLAYVRGIAYLNYIMIISYIPFLLRLQTMAENAYAKRQARLAAIKAAADAKKKKEEYLAKSEAAEEANRLRIEKEKAEKQAAAAKKKRDDALEKAIADTQQAVDAQKAKADNMIDPEGMAYEPDDPRVVQALEELAALKEKAQLALDEKAKVELMDKADMNAALHPPKLQSPLQNPALAAMDVNADGKVDYKDMVATLDVNGDGKVDYKDMVATLDVNGDGKVDYKDVVATLDVNGDGKVDYKDMVATLDVNGDGKLDSKDVVQGLKGAGKGLVGVGRKMSSAFSGRRGSKVVASEAEGGGGERANDDAAHNTKSSRRFSFGSPLGFFKSKSKKVHDREGGADGALAQDRPEPQTEQTEVEVLNEPDSSGATRAAVSNEAEAGGSNDQGGLLVADIEEGEEAGLTTTQQPPKQPEAPT